MGLSHVTASDQSDTDLWHDAFPKRSLLQPVAKLVSCGQTLRNIQSTGAYPAIAQNGERP
jgi:hypothetical protein